MRGRESLPVYGQTCLNDVRTTTLTVNTRTPPSGVGISYAVRFFGSVRHNRIYQGCR